MSERTPGCAKPYTILFAPSNSRRLYFQLQLGTAEPIQPSLLHTDVPDPIRTSRETGTRVAQHVCDTLRHVARRRSSASLPSYRAVPRRERIEATHQEIIAAAVHAFRVRGYQETKMSAVAAIAGVSPRTLYRYFGSKSELFAATVEEATEKFFQQLSEQIRMSPLRSAIIEAVEHADIELNGESREMMRLAAADEKAWRYFLGATSRVQPMLAAALRAVGQRDQPAAPSAEELLFWDVRASALLGAITTAYRRWATVPGSELSNLIATAVDVVLPVVTSARPHWSSTGPSPSDPIQD